MPLLCLLSLISDHRKYTRRNASGFEEVMSFKIPSGLVDIIREEFAPKPSTDGFSSVAHLAVPAAPAPSNVAPSSFPAMGSQHNDQGYFPGFPNHKPAPLPFPAQVRCHQSLCSPLTLWLIFDICRCLVAPPSITCPNICCLT